MKNIFKILFFAAAISASGSVSAQVGQTGAGNFDYENIWLCDDSTDVSFYRVYLHRIGFSTILVGTFKPDGTSYTPSTQIVGGPCPGASAAGADSTYTYDYTEQCDKSAGIGVSYISVFKTATKQTTGVYNRYKIGNFVPNTGGSYSPGGGTQLAGFCIGLAVQAGDKVNVLMTSGSSGTLLYADNGMSVDILNTGNNIAQLTINSDTLNLLPGERWFCAKQWDEVTRAVYRCPAVTYNCNYLSQSTSLHISQMAY